MKQRKKKKMSKKAKIILVVILLLIIGVLGCFLLTNDKEIEKKIPKKKNKAYLSVGEENPRLWRRCWISS